MAAAGCVGGIVAGWAGLQILVAMRPDGRVVAMVGGRDYARSPFNRATQAHRQPGSAFKPLTYLAALSKGLQPNTMIWDAPLTLPPVAGTRSSTLPELACGISVLCLVVRHRARPL